MALPNIFSKEVSEQVIDRINKLNPDSQPLWGKMSVGKMLAHCSVTYEFVYTDNHPKPNFFLKLFLKLVVKENVVNEKEYKTNLRTAPAFIIEQDKDFDNEKSKLITYIQKTQELGSKYFENRESLSFGMLTVEQWNNMFYKHLDHHLKQFGV